MSEGYDPGPFDEYPDSISCPRCSGFGQIDCHCGGDLCVCENYGERDCPLCCGEGEVSETTYDRYEDQRRKFWADYLAAVSRREAAKILPQTTTKRAKVKAARKQRHRK